jgi:hypothetical protein
VIAGPGDDDRRHDRDAYAEQRFPEGTASGVEQPTGDADDKQHEPQNAPSEIQPAKLGAISLSLIGIREIWLNAA